MISLLLALSLANTSAQLSSSASTVGSSATDNPYAATPAKPVRAPRTVDPNDPELQALVTRMAGEPATRIDSRVPTRVENRVVRRVGTPQR